MNIVEPFVSIIVPVYKVPEQYLRKCIESLINQTYKNIEILLVDDGSPDNCGIICDEYSNKVENVKTIHKINGGLSSARNMGVNEAKGKYILFVDGDDWLDSETCEELFTKTQQYDADLFMFCMSKDYSDKSIPYNYFLKDNYMYEGEDIKWLQTQVLNYNSNIATVTTKLIKRDILINKNIFHNERLKQGAEGIVFNIDLFGSIQKAVFIKEFFYHYIYNETSISASYNEQNIYLVLDCFEEIATKISVMQNSEALIKANRNRMIYAIVAAVISGFFNPSNPDSYKTKKEKCIKYLQCDIVRDAINNADLNGVSNSRKIMVFLIKIRCYFLIYLLGLFRKWQKNHL